MARAQSKSNIQTINRNTAGHNPRLGLLMAGHSNLKSAVEDLRERMPDIDHPGPLLSMVPVIGSGLEAYADFQDGDYLGAALNAGLAVTDLSGAGALGHGVAKAVALNTLKGSSKGRVASQAWSAVSKRLASREMRKAEEEAHHGLIPRNGWGKAIPDQIKNNYLNLKILPKATHRRMTGSLEGAPRFNPAQRYWYGTPGWWKAVNASALGHTGVGAREESWRLDDRPDRRRPRLP